MFFIIDLVENNAGDAVGSQHFHRGIHLVNRGLAPTRHDDSMVGKAAHCPGIFHRECRWCVDDDEIELVTQIRQQDLQGARTE